MTDPQRQLAAMLRLRSRLDRKIDAALRERDCILRDLEWLRREAVYSDAVFVPAGTASQATLDANA